MDIASRLDRPDWDERLARLAVEEQDRGPLIDAIAGVLADDRRRERAAEAAQTLLVDQLGKWRDVWERPGFEAGEVLDPLLAGAVPLCALLATIEDVREYHAARGIDEQTTWASLADVGQQVSKHRLVTGRPGLTQYNWLRNVWSGCYLQVGRLQYELFRTDFEGQLDAPVTVLNTHIPALGPMRPDDVDASLVAAPAFFERHFADQLEGPIEWVMCYSWLLDQELPELLPGSNIADFASRWEPVGSSDRDRDGYYFVFNIEPLPSTTLPFKLDELPQDTSLERALVERWRRGGHVEVTTGRIPLGQVRRS